MRKNIVREASGGGHDANWLVARRRHDGQRVWARRSPASGMRIIMMMAAAYAALLVVAGQPVSLAYAATSTAATSATVVSITANRRSGTAISLTVTNTSGRLMTSVRGTTSVPSDIVADGQATTVQWGVDDLAAGASATARRITANGTLQNTDMIIDVKAGSPTLIGESQTTQSSASHGANAAGGQSNSNARIGTNAGTLAQTGSSVAGLALFALALACYAVALRSDKNRMVLQRSMAILGTLAMVAGVVSAVPDASADQPASSDVTTAITIGKKAYQLDSRVQITYDDPAASLTSLAYAKAMGAGWNLGNSFDAVNTDAKSGTNGGGETAWGNSEVTPELIRAIKQQGFSSIRIPMTIDGRYTEHADAKTGQYRYVINQDWLNRYKQVVDWAVSDGLYVMINIHHDSWMWLNNWDGTQSEGNMEYRMYTDFWKQLSATFADEPALVSFETINEPQFKESGTGDALGIDKITKLNAAAYSIIRGTAGSERRMIVMPTLDTKNDDQYTKALQKQITGLHDAHILATVHYYSEWVYSANLGRTGFDESLYGDGRTARSAADVLAQHIKDNFTDHGIGTVVGEYGLLSYDSAGSYLQPGEELKYYEYMNHLARDGGYALLFWDNGSGIDRTSKTFEWKDPQVGAMLQASIHGRSSYVTGLNTVYMSTRPSASIAIPLTLNGNAFTGIAGLREGTDYTYDSRTTTVTLLPAYLDTVFDDRQGYGQCADLTMQFSSGASWHEYLVHSSAPAMSASASAQGTRTGGITIPVDFKGNTVKSVSSYRVVDGKQQAVGPNSSWWQYLQYGTAFTADYAANAQAVGTFTVEPAFFADSSVVDGDVTMHIEYFDGSTQDVPLTISGNTVMLKR